MRASDRLDAYFAARETHHPSSSALARVDDVVEDATRARIRRKIELRLLGHRVDVPRPRTRVARETAVEDADESFALAPSISLNVDDDGDDDDDVTTTVEDEETRVEAPRASRRADAVLRRLVDEFRASTTDAEDGDESGTNDDETWTPSGIDWEAPPSFLRGSANGGARFAREKYPDAFERRDRELA
jgi:hypothetical protein